MKTKFLLFITIIAAVGATQIETGFNFESFIPEGKTSIEVYEKLEKKDLQNKIKTLNEKKDMIKFFAYSISHDLKSPAIGIYGLSRRLQEKYAPILDEKGKVYCTQILKAGGAYFHFRQKFLLILAFISVLLIMPILVYSVTQEQLD